VTEKEKQQILMTIINSRALKDKKAAAFVKEHLEQTKRLEKWKLVAERVHND